MRDVRTRFAPSPTGDLHIGNARTALFNYLFARRHGGRFIVRIEDTDTARSEASHEKTILADLGWLGLLCDEGPDRDGKYGPYRQSERLSIYHEQAARLFDRGSAYRCFCSKERLDSLKAEQIKKGVPPRYDNRCRNFNTGNETPPSSAPPVLRFAVPGGTVRFDDGVHGEVTFDASVMGDFIIMGSDAIPSYNFAVVVDDALMEISHVLRGDDHLSNTPRQLMLFAALGFTPPRYYHLPLVLSPEKTPLSKRDSASSVRSIREGGFLSGAVVNTIARLGWSPGSEASLSLEDLARSFDAERLSKSPSVFDLDRLKAYNKEAISNMPGPELLSMAGTTPAPLALAAAKAAGASAATIGEFIELMAPFTEDAPEPDAQAREALSSESAKAVLASLSEAVKGTGELDEEAYKCIMSEVKSKTGAKGKNLFMPVRAALTGRCEGIELVTVFKLLGRERIAARLKRHIK